MSEYDEHKEMERSMETAYQYIRELQQPDPSLFQKLHQIPSQHSEPEVQASWRTFLSWGIPAGALLGLGLFFFIPHLFSEKNSGSEIRSKGAVWRVLYAHQTSQPKNIRTQTLHDGASMYPGDFIQFVYTFSVSQFVQIIGVNQKGRVYKLFPTYQVVATKMPRGRGSLPRKQGREGSFLLDDYLGWERFFILTSDKPFSFSQVKKAVLKAWLAAGRDLHNLKVLDGPWQSDSYLIQKRPRPSRTP